jgi:hypothetical protein
MKQSDKIKLAHTTTWIMVVTISLIALFFVGFVITTTFDLNVFTSRASNFIISFIGFASVIIACSAILNVSLNISLIADSRTQDLKENDSKFNSKKYLLLIFGLISLVTVFLFLGDYLTRQNEKNKIISEANDILTRYKISIDKIPLGLADTSKIGQIPETLKFLSNQKDEFPSVSIITIGNLDGQMTFLEINEYDNYKNLKEPFYGNSFYKCQIQDCDYLNSFFTGQTKEKHFWTNKDDYRLYFPFDSKGRKFIILFSKTQRYGKMGSR